MFGTTKERKITSENRSYQDRWENEYFVANNNGKLQCLVCLQVISVCKEYNVKWHYYSLHAEKYRKYTGGARKARDD